MTKLFSVPPFHNPSQANCAIAAQTFSITSSQQHCECVPEGWITSEINKNENTASLEECMEESRGKGIQRQMKTSAAFGQGSFL